jgi:signal transduction histidine kinase
VLPPVVIATIAALIILTYIERFRQQQDIEKIAEQTISTDAGAFSVPLWHLDEASLRNLIEAIRARTGVECVFVVDNLSHFKVEGSEPCLESEGSVSVSYPILSPEGVSEEREALGELQIAYDKNSLLPNNARFFSLTLIAITLVLVLTISVAVFVANRITVGKPLSRVQQSLNRFSETGERHPVDWNTDDELGLLITQYNHTLTQQEALEYSLRKEKKELEATLEQLHQAQHFLVESETMASLGRVVAGVAHEINTPLGAALTIATSLSSRTSRVLKDLENNTLKRSSLEAFCQDMDDAAAMLERNLKSAATLVGSFKQIAVDQTSHEQRRFRLREMVEELVAATIYPRIKRGKKQVTIEIDPSLELQSYPGPLGQVLTNLVDNAVVHAFKEDQAGEIRISAQPINNDRVEISVSDNGKGIDETAQKRIFKPFYTTRMGQGGSGLGLNIVYNLVVQALEGEVAVESSLGEGSRFILHLPMQVRRGRASLERIVSSDRNLEE